MGGANCTQKGCSCFAFNDGKPDTAAQGVEDLLPPMKVNSADTSVALAFMNSFDYHGMKHDKDWGGLTQWGVSAKLKEQLVCRERQMRELVNRIDGYKVITKALIGRRDELIAERDAAINPAADAC